ncbi:SOS response-associated peptidase [Mycetocola spongiae]|nr:SOS response-associated peptidase [Mycetocola spongiae]
MCGRFAMDATVNEMITEFVEATGRRPEQWSPDWQASWNIAPTQSVPILVESARGPEPTLRFETASWSLLPAWSKTATPEFPTFNARSETAAEKPAFRDAVRSTRAIIFANGYYEWHTDENGIKTPYFVRPYSEEVIGFAGLYSWWADPQTRPGDPNRWHLTATILTAPAAGDLVPLHDRNPVFLPPEHWEHWIDTSIQGDQALIDEAVAVGAAEAEGFEFYPVNRLGGDGPELLEPASA